MLKYNSTITSPNGKESPFSISIDFGEDGLAGEMVWDGDILPMKNVRYQDGNSFYCRLFWLGVYTRTWIVAINNQGSYSLSIRIMGNPFEYILTEEGYEGFRHFVARLNLENPFPQKRKNPQEFDLLMDESELGQKSISLFEGSNIYKNLPVRFTSCTVNGSQVSVEHPRPLPQQLGTFIHLGYFATDAIIQIQWTFEVWDVPSHATLVIGAFRNDKLRDRTPLQSYTLQQFQSYKGAASLTV